MEWIKPGVKIDFVGKRIYFFLISLALIALSILSFLWPGPNWGIDFKGGTELRLRFKERVEIGKVRALVESLNLGEVQIQQFQAGLLEEAEQGIDFLIRVEELKQTKEKEGIKADKLISDKLIESFGEGAFTVLEVNYVGPKVGKELRERGAKALLYSLVGILFYVGFRFEFRYALGAVLALFHDAIISAGIYNLLQREWSLAIIAGLLTIIGYSVNDTIVVFDRIRETIRRTRRGNLRELINQGINETLSRTILTGLTTLMALVFLAVFGGGVIRNFSILMIFGLVIGTYSSIYIASSLVLLMEDIRQRRKSEEQKKEKK